MYREMADNTEERENDENAQKEPLLCGYGSCTPRWLQSLHNRKSLLISMCFCSLVQSFVINGLVPISISTLEKRFNLSSFETGLFSAVYNIAVLLAVLPVCHYGRNHKGKWTAWGMFILGIGSFVWTLPQFVTGPYQVDLSSDAQGQGYCIPGRNTTTNFVSNQNENLRYYLFVFLLGQTLHGLGVAPLYCIGVAYLDENVSQRSSPLYLGLFFGSSALGPLAGYMLGGKLLNIYGDVGKSGNIMNLTNDDPRWYGAWWIGFLISGTCAILASIPLFSFAESLPGSLELRQKDIIQTHRSMEQAPNLDFDTDFKHIPRHFLNLFKNPTYTAVIISSISETLLVGGFINFLPKLFEHLLNFAVSKAAIVAGSLIIPSVLLGNVLGGVVVRKFKLCCPGNLRLTMACRLVTLCLIFLLLLKCPQSSFGSYGNDEERTLIDKCNSVCSCSHSYNPVCNEQFGVSFYSPCYAGCREVLVAGKTWYNCSCVNHFAAVDQNTKPPTLFRRSTTKRNMVSTGLCTKPCPWKWLFLVLLALMVFGTFFPMMATSQVFLRCVPFDQRSLAMGIQWCIVRLTGSIPSAIVFGLAIDSTCILKTPEQTKSHCLRYNTDELAYVLLVLGLGFKFVSLVAIMIGLALYKPPKSNQDEVTNDIPDSPTPAMVTNENDILPNRTISTSESEL